MKNLTAKQKKFLKSLAHDLDPIVMYGQNGMSENFLNAMSDALRVHELIKLKFIDGKSERKELSQTIAEKADANLIGTIGNIAIYYRENPEAEDRKISLPKS